MKPRTSKIRKYQKSKKGVQKGQKSKKCKKGEKCTKIATCLRDFEKETHLNRPKKGMQQALTFVLL